LAESPQPITGVITTIAARCRRCYNCVRSCPAKAIRVQGGQACVIAERCLGCGNCIRVCAQNAKQVENALPAVSAMLAGPAPVAAMLAPSYPAAWEGATPGGVVAALRALGFAQVYEVGFGAELVAREYSRLLRRPPAHPLISTACPAVTAYVQKYAPELVPSLAPIVSPMIAMGRAIKEQYLPGAQVVFIGPCTAKKAEIRDPAIADAVDAAMTFQELARLLAEKEIDVPALTPVAADGPLPFYGGLFPVSGGLLKAASIQADVMDDSVAVVEGPSRCLAALQELSEGRFPAKFLDALFCEGCVSGPAFCGSMTPLSRKALITAHVRSLQAGARRMGGALRRVAGVRLARAFQPEEMGLALPNETEIRDILARSNKSGPEDELNCGACGYATCRDKAVAVYQGLAEPEMCLPYLIDQLQVNLERLTRSKEEIERARELANRAQQLASMGQLAADIAHEVSNPLGNIVVYAQLLWESLPPGDARREDVATIVAEALECREVMSSLQGFARQREPQWEPDISLRAVLDKALGELEPKLTFTDVDVEVNVPDDLPLLIADPAQLTQVVVTLLTNSLEAIEGSGRIWIEGRPAPEGHFLELAVSDNGRGIPPDLLPKLFQPFITTKEVRPGAGLGLAVVHGIIHAHGGEVHVQSKPGFGTTFTVSLPLDVPAKAPEAAKVLVVDDDPDFLEQHRLMLAGMGFEVVTAERSDEALEVAGREIPDAFLLDLMMERNDSGARLARTLRRDPRFRRAPIILLTSVVQDMGFEFQRNPREVLEWMKADAWFDKPAPVAELANTLRRLLAGAEETPPSAENLPVTDEAPAES
jgi:signal transduction histidine kinase/iron only hydrogenase large subunit-like protein/CheY-like chemotaxis protein